jgi:hypothetical protein
MQIVASIPLTNRELSLTVGGNPADHSCVPRPCSNCPSCLLPANTDRIGGERGHCLEQRAARLQDPLPNRGIKVGLLPRPEQAGIRVAMVGVVSRDQHTV